MRAVVTGGAGFIGSTLVDRLLDDGHEVHVIDDLSTGAATNLAAARRKRGFSFLHGDITEVDLEAEFARRRPHVVFHLAAQASVATSLAQPARDCLVNVVGTVRVADAARRSGVGKVVFAASGGTLYGDVAEELLPADESLPHRPTSPYGIAKASALHYLEWVRQSFEIEVCSLALANVYGPRQDPAGEAGVIAIFCDRALANQPLVVHGDGGQTRDFVYVDDVVDAFVRAATHRGAPLINIGSGTETSVAELAATVVELTGSTGGVTFGEARPNDVVRSSLDARLAEAHLGWSPETSLAEGVQAVLGALASRLGQRREKVAAGGARSFELGTPST